MSGQKRKTKVQLGKQPEFVGRDYLVVGTQDKAAWKHGVQQQPRTLDEMLEDLHDFKEVVIFKPVGGWG